MPRRTCLGCRQSFDKAALLRFVSSAGALKADGKGVLPGRGAYLCRKRECMEAAFKRKDAFSKALRERITLPGAEDAGRIMKETGV